MASDSAKKIQYEYNANSNLVLQADRSLIDSRPRDEPTGEVKSITNYITKHRMGDKFQRSKPSKGNFKPKNDSAARESLYFNNLDEMAGIFYKPKTNETKVVYESILTFIQDRIGEQPREILVGAADEVLATLKNDSIKDKDKYKEIMGLLGSMEDDRYTILVNLTKKITDYFADTDFGDVDETIGVTVQYEDESDDNQDTAVLEESETESDEDLGDQAIQTSLAKMDISDESVLNCRDIDAYWLQRELNKFFNDAEMSHRKAKEVLDVLKASTDERDIENRLMLLLGHEKFSIIKILRIYHKEILFCTMLSSAQTPEERDNLEQTMMQTPELARILHEFKSQTVQKPAKQIEPSDNTLNKNISHDDQNKFHQVDLQSLAFSEGSHLMANKKCHLPEGSFRKQRKGYEEVHVPAPKSLPLDENERLLPVSDLPEFAKLGFSGYQHLNRIQSKIAPNALNTDENLLVCAPTGSGKTNVALMCMLRVIGQYLNQHGKPNLDDFKIVYIAPMKSLVQEMVQNFSKRLSDYGISVAEMTGDHQLNRDQIDSTQLIICTPEKWDIVTRKAGEKTFTRLVRLVIVDEIHLLHDDRGPVLEALISRIIRLTESSQQAIRIVGLSATLPNYQDVGRFIRVSPENLFYFSAAHRPVPLEQQYIGVTEKKPLKSIKIMNDIVYEKIMECAGKHQVIVFVHSRKETLKTARVVRDMCLEKETLGLFLRSDSASAEILRTEADQSKNSEFKDLLPFGLAIHHAGMNKVDRKLVEDLFADGHLQVIFSTATLAWGVNLPAYTVIIKGTQIYNPEKGAWVELSSMDVLQMLGRAGRPQYDSKGLGILITTHPQLQYYLSLMNQQLPIESQMVSKLTDHLNAEVALGCVTNIEEGARWLTYTYLYIRMLRNPSLYGMREDEVSFDEFLLDRRMALIHSAAVILDKAGLLKYDQKSGEFQSCEFGRIASHYYCTLETMSVFNRLLRPTTTQIELFRIVSMSSEFKYLTVRAEEKIELMQLLEKVPIPIKESLEDPATKVNVLLQAYISQLKLEGFVLMCDMVYVTQSAARLCRTIFEICCYHGWAEMAEQALNLCKMVDKRMWWSMSPLRQFTKLPPEVVRKLEKKDLSWDRFYDLEPHEIGEIIHAPKMGKILHKFIHHFPKFELATHVQPITRSSLRVELTITPDFVWDESIHGNAESFWILATDVDNERILHIEYFVLNHRFAEEDHYVKFLVSLYEPLPPTLFVKIVSDRWMHSQTTLPVSLLKLILPDKNAPPTELLDLQPLPVSSLNCREFEAFFPFTTFNAFQTQVFNTFYNTSENVLLAGPPGSGKTLCALLAIFSFKKNFVGGKCVYISPYQAVCDDLVIVWKPAFETLGLTVGILNGESTTDIKTVNQSNIIVSNPENWDMFSRRWKQRKVMLSIKLFIVDDLHMLGSSIGPCIEIICSRIRYISSQIQQPIRIVGLSNSLSNAKDVAQWLGISANDTFNFHPSSRTYPVNVHVQGFSLNNPISRILAMSRVLHQIVDKSNQSENIIVFVASRSQAKLTALDLAMMIATSNQTAKFLNHQNQVLLKYSEKLRENELKETLSSGVGYLHEGMSKLEMNIIRGLYTSHVINILIVSRELAPSLNVSAHSVVILDTQFYDGKFHSYVDYSVVDLLKMMGCAAHRDRIRPADFHVLCLTSKKEQCLKFLREPLPIESHLDHCLHDHFCAEIITKAIENKQEAVDYLTWTFLYRRLTQNPNYYNMNGITHRHLSDHLSELVENTLNDLANSKCIEIEDDVNVYPLNSGMIASYYYISYSTLELFSASLSDKTKLKALIEIIASAQEFESIPLRLGEDALLKMLLPKITFKPKGGRLSETHNKCSILIQAYLSRIALPAELQIDADHIISRTHKLVQAAVDVLSSNGWLQPAIVAMEFAQMITQAVWSKDSPLYQIPHFTSEIVSRCLESKIENIFDLLELDDQPRRELLSLSEAQLREVAQFCNRYPSIDVKYVISDDGYVMSQENVLLSVELERDDDVVGPVIAPFFPYVREEAVWVLVGQVASNTLSAIKRVNLQKSSSIKLQFSAPEIAGVHTYSLYVISDSYLGSDQEFSLSIHVKEFQAKKRKAEEDETIPEPKKRPEE